MRILVVTSLLLLPACLFMPDIADSGYVACADDGDCAAGRFCEEKVCAPPPWNDEKFGLRQLLLVKNPAETTLPKGAAIPVVIGDGGVIALDDFGTEGRFTQFDRKTNTWSTLPVFLDRDAEPAVAWLPLSSDVAPNETAMLGWMESFTEAGKPTLLEDPTSVFTVFDTFDESPLDDAWFVKEDNGTPPNLGDGVINVADNQVIVLQTPLRPPLLASFFARVNGQLCDDVFIGLVGTDDAIFNGGHSAGLFINPSNNLGEFVVAPEETSVPTPIAEDIDPPGAFSHIALSVDGPRVRLAIDDVEVGARDDLLPAFTDDPLFLAVQVNGACSVDLQAVTATPLPLPLPTVHSEKPVEFQLQF